MSKGWRVTWLEDGEACVVPIDDLRAHEIDGPCWCRPFDQDGVTVHRSADGREHREPGGMLQ